MPGHLNQSNQNHRLTGVRREVKYLLERPSGMPVMEQVGQHLPAKSVGGATSSFRVSVYLDTAAGRFAHAELSKARNSVKLRVKDYYLIEADEPVFASSCWLEVKSRMGTMVEKSRFAVPRMDVPGVLQSPAVADTTAADRLAREAFDAMREGQPLSPILVVHYLRYTFEDPQSQLRVTFDDHVSYHAPPPELFRDGQGCGRGDLAPPLFVEPRWVVEIKSLGTPPRWVDEIFDVEHQVDYSKFGTGVRQLVDYGLLNPGGEKGR